MEKLLRDPPNKAQARGSLLWSGFLLCLLLAVPAASQTSLLWSARYDSGGDDRLGEGRPFQVEGSGAVTLAGLVGSEFLMVRYLPDGAFDKARVQQPVPLFAGTAVAVDGTGRSAWAGYPAAGTAVGDQAPLLMRFGFTGSPESLFSHITGPLEGWYGRAIEEAGDDGLLLVYHLSGHAGLQAEFVTKLGGSGAGWTVQAFGDLCPGRVIAPDHAGGALVGLTSPASLVRIDPSGVVVWSRSCGDSGWPWEGNPYLALVDVAGNALVAGRSGNGDFLTARLDPSGAAVWQRTFDGAGHGVDSPSGLVRALGGSLYVTGSAVGSTGSSDYATLKYDATGNLLWSRTYDSGADDAPAGVAVDAAGNAWVTGASGSDVFTVKYDPSGTPVFSHRFTSSGTPIVSGVVLDSWGNATVAFSAAGDIFVLRYGEAPTRVGPLSFQTLDPCRAFDSREPALGGPSPLAGPSDHAIPLAGVCGIPGTAKAVSLNVTAVGSTHPGNLVLFAAGQTAPLTSVINYSAGQTRANNATVELGPNADLALRVNQSGGTVHALVDVVGYWR